MKKLLYLLLLIPALCFSQPVRSPNLYLKGVVGKPTITPTSLNDFAVDFYNKVIYRSASTSSTSTNKWVVESDTNIRKVFFPALASQGPQGIQGPQGPVGLTGPAGKDGVCPPCAGTSSSDIYHIITNGIDDTPAIQRAVDSSYRTGREVFIDGFAKMSGGIKIAKDQSIIIRGTLAKITATNTGTWTFFYSDAPATVQEAEGVYAFRKVKFIDIVLQGQGTQNAYDLHASEGARYEGLWAYDMQTAYNLTFSLRSRVIQCEANNCVDGLVIQSGVGRYVNNTGNTTSTSCSNGVTVEDFRAYGGANSNTGIKVLDASLVSVNGFVAEGQKFNIGYDYQAMSSTSTGLNLTRMHLETKYPCTVSAIKIRSSTMSHVIDFPNLIKPSTLVSVDNAGGYPQINIKNVSNQRLFWDGTTPVFNNGSGSSWKFSNCDNPINATDIVKMFMQTIAIGCGTGAGANKVCIDNQINR